MQKKKLLGILAVLMVFALALTGCGQQSGEQNAGATGSESQNGTTAVDGGKNEGEVTAEPEGPDVGQVDNRKPVQDTDGNYIYTITVDNVQTEVKTCINVWDYITDDTPYDHVDYKQMLADLGWEAMPAGYGAAKFTRNDGSYTLIGGTRTGDEYDLSSGESRLYDQGVTCYESNNESVKFSSLTVSACSVSSDPYLIGKSDTYVSFEQIVAYAYLLDYYRNNVNPAFETGTGSVCVP
ncbi:hypothetical protein OCV99_05780 [Dorea acetigenes]|uniref:Uncharacterized protein n=1 Tax=Dorea acetigenes TaxID=2981787 RepID=A0ABT2RL46_9FIRM|nr:hypothetical protein [Dorea acetigenes]MCU6686071.1 hypothetical protein [Dorea acetigenes]SCI77873.1 Uncharacterised protein [uncultured Clostridium sp.]